MSSATRQVHFAQSTEASGDRKESIVVRPGNEFASFMSQGPLYSVSGRSVYWRRVLFLGFDFSRCSICCIHVRYSFPFEQLCMSEKQDARMSAFYRVLRVHCVSPACRFGFGYTGPGCIQSYVLELEFISEQPTEHCFCVAEFCEPITMIVVNLQIT
jgi:hypothetical protein